MALVGTLVALLAFGRFRHSRSRRDLWIACSVALLAWVHTLFNVIPNLVSPESVGHGVSERVETWGAVVVSTFAAAYLVAAGLPQSRKSGDPRRSRDLQLLASATVAAAAVILLVCFAPVGSQGLLQRFSWPQSLSSLLRLGDALLFFVAFGLLSRKASVTSDSFVGWIAAGCVLAGFGMISYALLPPGKPDWLRSGDVLRVAAVCTWALGAASEIRWYWSAIAESARQEARRAVALDLHDGLAQELALLNSYSFAPPEVRAQPQWHEELRATAERALADARRAIVALADEPQQSATDIEMKVLGSTGYDAGPLQRESMVRIVREAVTNAVRHGGGTHIDIAFHEGEPWVLRVCDDGVGFDPDLVDPEHFGLVSMRESAREVGALLTVHSAPGQGTTVEVLWPES